MLHRTTAALILTAPLLAWSAGCSKSNPDTLPPEESPAVAPAESDQTAPDQPFGDVEPAIPEADDEAMTDPGAVAALTDPQILGIVNDLHQAEIDQGELARAKGRLKAVKDYGAKMVSEHGEADRRLDEMTARLGLGSDGCDLGDRLRADAQSKTDALMAMEAGDAYDRAYIDTQVELHAQALELVDRTLLPAARTEDLRAELGELIVLFRDHLDRAKEIQRDLADKPQS